MTTSGKVVHKYVEIVYNWPGEKGESVILTDWEGRVRTSLFVRKIDPAINRAIQVDRARELANFLGRKFKDYGKG